MDLTSPARLSQILFEKSLKRGGRYLPSIGAFNDKAWCFILGVEEKAFRGYLDQYQIPYKVIARQRWCTPEDIWNAIPNGEDDKPKPRSKRG